MKQHDIIILALAFINVVLVIGAGAMVIQLQKIHEHQRYMLTRIMRFLGGGG